MNTADRPVAGILYLVFGLGVLVAQDVIMKLLSDQYPVWQFGVVRSIVAVSIIALVLIITGKSTEFLPNRLALLVIRGLLTFFGFTFYYLAIAAVSLAEAASIFIVAPLIPSTSCKAVLSAKPAFVTLIDIRISLP